MTTMPTSPQPTMYAAAHQQVELAMRPRVMQRYLASTGAQQKGDGRGKVACHILDAKYEPGTHCSVLYQLGERLVIGELQWNGTAQATPEMTAHSRPLAMQVYPFEHDPALPGLTTVLDGQRMAGILNMALPECVAGEARVLRCQVTPLRYRLGKRCTLRFDLRLRDEETGAILARTLYGKLYHSAVKAQAVYDEMQMLAATPSLHAARVELAQAIAFVPELPMVLQAPVDGVPLEMLLNQPQRTTLGDDPRLCDGIRRAAAALAALHEVEGCTSRVRAIASELDRFQRRSAQIMAVDSAVGNSLNELARALSTWLDRLPAWGAENRLVHGDCKPSQFFIGDAHVALLDFDHCGVADPAADVGNFLASLRQLGVGQVLKQRDQTNVAALQQSLAGLEEEFLNEYLVTRNCQPEFRWRATWYQAVALLRKALRSFARSTRSPLPSLLVQEAWRCLAVLPAE